MSSPQLILNKTPTVLVAGDFAHSFYEPAFCDGLRQCGAKVVELRVRPLFGPGELLQRAQTKYCIGPGVVLANAMLLAKCRQFAPDYVLAWRAPWLFPSTIRLVRRACNARIALYNNDDPFGPDRDFRIWQNFRRGIPFADICFAYRKINIDEYSRAGARRVRLLRSFFVSPLHRPLELDHELLERFSCDVVFVGHCEPDRRLDLMDALLASGLHVRIFGSDWDTYASGRRWERMLPINLLYGEGYVRAIAGAKIAVVFLSTRNRDQYTRRCFEIPAIGTMMLAPRTDEILSLFDEGAEVACFSDAQELVEKAVWYAKNDAERARIAAGGRSRCLRDGYDAAGRAREFLAEMAALDRERHVSGGLTRQDLPIRG